MSHAAQQVLRDATRIVAITLIAKPQASLACGFATRNHNPNALNNAACAFCASPVDTTTPMRISLVFTICTFTPTSAARGTYDPDARVAPQTDAQHRQQGHIAVEAEFRAVPLLDQFACQQQTAVEVRLENGKRQVRGLIVADVLHDHVDHHAPLGYGG